MGHNLLSLGQCRITLSTNTASEIRQLPGEKHRVYFVYSQAFLPSSWCGAAAGVVQRCPLHYRRRLCAKTPLLAPPSTAAGK